MGVICTAIKVKLTLQRQRLEEKLKELLEEAQYYQNKIEAIDKKLEEDKKK